MSKQHENGPRTEELEDTDLDEVSGGLGNFEIQDLRKQGIVAPEGKPAKREPGTKSVFENITYKY